MGRSRYGKEVNEYNGLTDTLAANILRTRKAGTVVKSGRLVSMGAYLGANTTAVANARLAAHLINPGTLDPATLLAESDRFGVNTLWNANGAGGAVFELPVAIPWHLGELGDRNLWLQGYYQGASTGTLPDATALTTWPPVGGSGPVINQASASRKPILKLAQQNGLDVVRFDGVNDDFAASTTLLPPMAQPYSWAVVWKPANIASDQVAIQLMANSGSPLLMRSAAGNQSMHAGSFLNQAMPGGAWAISLAVFNGANSINMLNGVPVIGNAGTNPIIAADAMFVGSSLELSGWLNGDIGEIFMDNRAWTMDECQYITQRLAWVWGLTSVLPTGFPYKTAPYLINGGKLVNAGDDIAIGVHSNGTLRMPANYVLGGHKWEQTTSGLNAPSPMVPTVDTDDDKGVSRYFVVEDNRPPVLTPVNPVDGQIIPMGLPTYTFSASDPDRVDGYGDYIKQATVRIWERFRGSMVYAAERRQSFSKPSYSDRAAQSISIDHVLFTPGADYLGRGMARLAAWNNPAQADNTDLTTWVDTSAFGNNAVQTTVANKPKYRTSSGPASLPSIDFDGVNDYMTLSLPSSNDEAIFMLIKPDVIAGANRIILATNITGGRTLYIAPGGTLVVDKAGVANVGTTTGTIPVGSWSVISMVLTATKLRLSINGVVQNFFHWQTLVPGTASFLGGDGGAWFDGMIEDVIITKASELRPGDEERFVGYLTQAYGLSALLPSDHFYKNNIPGLRVSPPPPNTTSTTRLEGLPASNANGDVITQWSDTGPSASNSATQVTTANKPIWRSPSINGLGSADFDGVNDYLSMTTISSAVMDEACFALVKIRSFSTGPAILGTTVANGRIFLVDSSGTMAIWGNSGYVGSATPGGATPLNEWMILHWIIRTGSWEIGRNGVAVRGAPTGVFAAGGTTVLGGWNGSGSNYFNGQIAYVVRMPASQLGVDGPERWVGKIASDYGLQSLLPDNHPYRFESPGADIEHAWVIEAQDEVGGDSGTAMYGYDGELPEGTKTKFYTSSTGYSYDTISGIDIPNMTLDVNNTYKTSRRTPAYLMPTYYHPLGISSLGLRVRIAKKDANGDYQQDQISSWFYATIAPGGNFKYQWWRTLFNPLEFGVEYAAEVQYIDKNGIMSQWRGRRPFHTNYPPQQGSITSPANPTTVTSPPLTLFSVVDPDDIGVAYYAKPEWAIWETEVGSIGAGTSPPQFSAPNQVAVNSIGLVHIADAANGRIMILDANLGFSGVVNDPAVGVKGVTVDASNNIYVADTQSFVLKKYNPAGTLLLTSPVISVIPGFGPRNPSHIIMLGNLNVAASIPGSSNGFTSAPISTMNPGVFTSHDGKGANRNTSVIGIAYGNINLDEFWAADYGTADIKIYTSPWTLKDKWGDFDRIRRPLEIVVHPDTGNVWITDETRKTIMEYSRYGDFLGEVGPVFVGTGGVATNHTLISGLAFNVDADKFYDTDAFQNKVRRFRVSETAEKTNTGCAGEIAIKGPISTAYQSFEDGSTTWAVNNSGGFTATGGIASTSPAEGNNYYHIAFTAGPTKPSTSDPVLAGYDIHNNNPFPVVEGFSYQVSAKFRRDKVGMYGQVGIGWRHESVPSFGIGTSWSSIVKPRLNGWTEVRVSDVAPPGANSAYVVLFAGVDVVGLTYPINIDWDDIQIEDGVRYLRGANYLGGDDYSYQLTTTDMPTKGAYTIMARGRDGDSPGDWSDVSTLYYVNGPTATIITPASGQVFTTATPTFLWQLTAGAQWAYKVEVLDTNGIIIYTSNWIQSVNARSHQVPASAGLQDGASYIGRLWIDDGNLQVLV